MTDTLTPDQIGWLRGELGATPSDQALQEKFERLESVRDVAIETMRERRNALLETPLSVTLTGVAAVNNTENVKAYERRISALVTLDDDPSDDPVPGSESGVGRPEPLEIVRLTRTRGR